MSRQGAGLGAAAPLPQPHHTDPLRDFTDWLHGEFGNAPRGIILGKLQRFDHPDGKRGNLRCWCVMYLDNRPAGAAGDWRDGSRLSWTADAAPLSIEDRRRELRSCSPAHGCLNDGIVNSQHLGDSVVHNGGSHSLSSFSY